MVLIVIELPLTLLTVNSRPLMTLEAVESAAVNSPAIRIFSLIEIFAALPRLIVMVFWVASNTTVFPATAATCSLLS